MCGTKVPGNMFYIHRKLFFDEHIESQYYYHLDGKKAKNSSKDEKFVTGNIWGVCYSFQDVFSDSEINRSRNIGEKNPLLICRY